MSDEALVVVNWLVDKLLNAKYQDYQGIYFPFLLEYCVCV